MKIALLVLALILILAGAALLPIRPYQDFQLIYHAGMGLVRGISLYDHSGQVDMIARLANVPPEQVFVLPFPYPPWYALSTLWLQMLPIDVAARSWFAVNLVMLFASTGMLTAGQPIVKRALLFLGALFWLPALGGLFVGQYGFPVLLGAALMIRALQRQEPALVGLAAALLTFKPHLGGLVLILAIVTLVQRRDRFGRNALLGILAAAALLLAIGFLASPNWPVDYFRSLTGFKDVSQCHQCVSLSMAAAGLAGGGLDVAVWIAVVAAAVICVWLVGRWQHVSSTPDRLVATAILITLLISPYLQNYDYLLLLIPFISMILVMQTGAARIALASAYVLPFVGLALWGTAGNESLIVSALILSAPGLAGHWGDR